MQMFWRFCVFVFLGVAFLFVGGTVDVHAQVPFLTVHGDTDGVYAVGDTVEVVFVAELGASSAPGVKLIITYRGLTDVVISSGGTTDVLGSVIVRGTIADDTGVYIQAEWEEMQLSARVDGPDKRWIAEQTAQAVFDRHSNTFRHPDVHEHFPDVLQAFNNPDIQNVLNSVVINHFVREPEYIRAFYLGVDERIITLLTTDNEFRALFKDEAFQDVLQDPAELEALVRLIEAQPPLHPEILALEANFSSITGRNPDSGAPQGIVTISAYTTAQRTFPEIASIEFSVAAQSLRNWEVTTSIDAGGRRKWSAAVDPRTLPDTITKDNPGARNAVLDNRKRTVRAVAIGADGTVWPSHLTARFSVDNVDDVPPIGPTNIITVADADGPIEANEDGSYTVGGLIDEYDETGAPPIVKFTVQPTAQSVTYDSVHLVQTDADGIETFTESRWGQLEFTVDVGELENATYMFHALAVDADGNIQTDASPKITVHVENYERPAPQGSSSYHRSRDGNERR